jgi:hypothetical protein
MARPSSRSIALAALLCTTAACSDATTDPSGAAELLANDDASFTVDRTVYTATSDQSIAYTRYRFQLVARFTNNTSQPVFLSRCFPNSDSPTFGVELLDPPTDRWGSAYDMAWACVGHDAQFEVAPGATRIDTYEISGPNAFDGHTQRPFGVLAGRMRLVYEVQGCRGDGACRLTGTIGKSAPFDVRVEQ